MILLTTALAAPVGPYELADASIEAEGVLESCRRAVAAQSPCQADRSKLAEASVVKALTSLVVHGTPAPEATADAWALDPTVTARWSDMLGPAEAEPSPWVRALLGPTDPEPLPAALPPPDRSTSTPAPVVADRWWSVALTAGHAPITESPDVGSQQSLRLQGAYGDGHLMALVETQVGRARFSSRLFGNQGAKSYSLQNATAYLAMGAAWTGTHQLRVTLGPTVGTTGFGPRATRRLAQEQDVSHDPATITVGTEVRARGRLQHERLAGVLEVRTSYDLTRTLSTYLNSANGGSTGTQHPWARRLQNTVVAELQFRTFERLWLTGGVRVAHHIAQRTQTASGTYNRITGIFFEPGLVWR